MSKWKTEHHFVSWLRLCPDNRISGDKIIGKGRLPTNNRVTNALRMAASTLRLSNTYLGAQFRRLRTKLGAPVAIKAMAAKLAPVSDTRPEEFRRVTEVTYLGSVYGTQAALRRMRPTAFQAAMAQVGPAECRVPRCTLVATTLPCGNARTAASSPGPSSTASD